MTTAAFDPVRFTTPDEQERWFETLARTVAIDFDGVLHPYTAGWVGSTPADEPPMPGALEFVRQLVDDGYRVVVFSTRCDHPDGLAGTVDWLSTHGFMGLVAHVTHEKPAAVAYIDDRAVPFIGTWDGIAERVAELAAVRPHGAAR